jgi:pyruvate,water dikinase
MKVPATICLSTLAYEGYLSQGGLQERILLELSRKDFREMRWEEIWDASLRIRNMFLTTPMRSHLSNPIRQALETHLGDGPFVVRSSALGEDSAAASFAGIHESYVNVRGAESVIEHVIKVWASLWSDAALLYRQELGLDPETSAMAVVIQEIIEGERSGIVFSQSPANPSHAVIESVYGLNQGLVDGAIEPDRWFIDRKSGTIIRHEAALREVRMVTSEVGTRGDSLPATLQARPPLGADEVRALFTLVMDLERLFGSPQDVEWTVHKNTTYVLQARPITTIRTRKDSDDRVWYMGLRKSYDTLKAMREKIEKNLIPEMIREASRLSETDPASLCDRDLADEIERRGEVHSKWLDTYRTEFIPFAHGIRLFGRVYNDTMKPEDPYEFMDLLVDTGLESVQRNRMLEEMADLLRKETKLTQELRKQHEVSETKPLFSLLETYLQRYGGLTAAGSQGDTAREEIILLVTEMATRPPKTKTVNSAENSEARKENFLSRFDGEERDRLADLLDLARTSYRLRDDDNIHLGNIDRQLQGALDIGRGRLEGRGLPQTGHLPAGEIVASLRDPGYSPFLSMVEGNPETVGEEQPTIRARQMIGQPAGPGISRGKARVIHQPSDLLQFKSGEILVCDAVDPNMTFLIPLAAGIVERRGGMLIHGAIIAREYGLPCVTGIPLATQRIRTGDELTVDGYLGIVILG